MSRTVSKACFLRHPLPQSGLKTLNRCPCVVAQRPRSPLSPPWTRLCLSGKGQVLCHAGVGCACVHSGVSACASHKAAWFPAASPALSSRRQSEAQARCPRAPWAAMCLPSPLLLTHPDKILVIYGALAVTGAAAEVWSLCWGGCFD